MTRLGVSAALVAGQWIRGDVDVVDGRVTSIGLYPTIGTRVLVSGFIDHQINGFGGVDFRRADEDDYRRVGEMLLETGVTGYHPTVFSMPVDGYEDALAVLAEVHRHRRSDHSLDDRAGRRAAATGTAGSTDGATALGMHLEGPFLAAEWRGAHDIETLIDPDPDVLDRLLGAGPVASMTLAPELPGAPDLIRRLVDAGVGVSIGHTGAGAAECHEAFDTGATMITHWGNAHRRFTMRDPGPAGAAVADGRVSIGVIADGVHIADDSLRMLAAAAPDRLVLVTDAIAAAGVDPETWNSKGTPVTVADGSARLADGTLAGSVATMDSCVRHMIDLGVPSTAVLAAAGGNRLRPGRSTGLVVMDDGWRVIDTLPARGDLC